MKELRFKTEVLTKSQMYFNSATVAVKALRVLLQQQQESILVFGKFEGRSRTGPKLSLKLQGEKLTVLPLVNTYNTC